MGEHVIVNRAVTGPPEGPSASPLAAIWGGIEAIAKRLIALEARPLARNGIDGVVGKDGKDGDRGAIGPQGEPGPEVDQSVIRQIVAEEVAKAIAAIPAPKQAKQKTTVTKHDDSGRIVEFIKEDI